MSLCLHETVPVPDIFEDNPRIRKQLLQAYFHHFLYNSNHVYNCKSRQPVVFTFKRGIQRVEGVRHALTFWSGFTSSQASTSSFASYWKPDIWAFCGSLVVHVKIWPTVRQCHQIFRSNYFANQHQARLSRPIGGGEEVQPTNENREGAWRDPQLPGCAILVIPSAKGFEASVAKSRRVPQAILPQTLCNHCLTLGGVQNINPFMPDEGIKGLLPNVHLFGSFTYLAQTTLKDVRMKYISSDKVGSSWERHPIHPGIPFLVIRLFKKLFGHDKCGCKLEILSGRLPCSSNTCALHTW